MPLSTVDLFSGIGGISLGIRPFTKTILYCEMDNFCQQVLYERMNSGDLDKAPIHSDIRNLCISDDMAPVMLVGGFPCQDVSSMGLMKGISEGERSGLFYEIVRIVKECPSIKTVFLENVANITNCGLIDVITEFVKEGFNMQWMMRSAANQGAPHIRNRWFCLAVREGSPPDLFRDIDDMLDTTCFGFSWSESEPIKRISFKPSYKDDESYDANWISRCQTLGNAVVPSVVREVFIDFVKTYKSWKVLSSCFDKNGIDVSNLQYPIPDSGLIVGTKFFAMPSNKIKSNFVKHDIDITIGQNKLDYYPTPRRGITHASSLTDRSIKDLPTVLLNSTITHNYLKDNGFENASKAHVHVVPNVRYIEWMMGFKEDWTKVKNISCKKSIHSLQSQEKTEIFEKDKTKINTKSKNSYNGMHMFMKENPGKGVVEIAMMWRALDQSNKDEYRLRANNFKKNHNHNV